MNCMMNCLELQRKSNLCKNFMIKRKSASLSVIKCSKINSLHSRHRFRTICTSESKDSLKKNLNSTMLQLRSLYKAITTRITDTLRNLNRWVGTWCLLLRKKKTVQIHRSLCRKKEKKGSLQWSAMLLTLQPYLALRLVHLAILKRRSSLHPNNEGKMRLQHWLLSERKRRGDHM